MARPATKAQTVADTIASRITGGELEPGAWLPGERALAQQHKVDRSTARRALRLLSDRGLVSITPGTGAQVRRDAADITRTVGTWRGFHVAVARGGQEAFTHTTMRDVDLDSETARWLGVPAGVRVLERHRVQGIKGASPVQTSTSWIAPEVTDRLPILREVNTGPGGMNQRMEDAGYRLRFEDVVTSRLPHVSEQNTLEIGPTEPVLVVWRRCYDQGDRILEVTRRVIVASRHELIYRYDAST